MTPPSIAPPLVIYARVSSDRQKEAHTVEGQLDALRQHFAQAGIPIAAEFIDEGVSGDLPFSQRPAATQMMRAVREGNARTVAVFLYDRFSRDVLEGLLAFRDLKAGGCGVWSLLEPFDPTTPMGEYMFVQSLNNAQLWKKTFLERSRLGSIRSARAGNWVGGSPPLGYRIEGKRGARQLVIDDETPLPAGFTPAGLIRWVFQRISVEGSSCAAVAEQLNNLGVPPPYSLLGRQEVGRKGNARVWYAATVHFILKATTYKGVVQYGKKGEGTVVEAQCPAIVTPEVWEGAKAAMKRNQVGAGRNTRRHYLLRGLMRCGTCGAAMCGVTHNPAAAERTEGRVGVSYYCIRAYQHRLLSSERCNGASAPGELEWAVWADIARFLTDAKERSRLAASIRRRQTGEAPPPPVDEIARLTDAIAGKARERDTILTLFRQGRIASDALDRQLEQIDQEETGLRGALEELRAASERTVGIAQAADKAMEALEAMAALWGPQIDRGDTPPFEVRRRLVMDLVESVTVRTKFEEDGEKVPEIHVRYRFDQPSTRPPSPASSGEGLSIVYDTVLRIRRNRK